MLRSRLARLLVFGIAALLLLMPVWYFLSASIATPVLALAGATMKLCFGWVQDYQLQGTAATLVTQLTTVVRQGDRFVGGMVAPTVDYRMLGYSLALLWALVVATRPPRWLPKLLAGTVVLLLVQSLGVCVQWLHDVLAVSGPEVARQTGLPSLVTDVVQFLFHFNLYVFTPLAPVLLWMAMDKAYVQSVWHELNPAAARAGGPGAGPAA